MTVNPYAGALGDGDALTVIEETPKRLAAVVAGRSAEAILAAPAPGKWSVRDVLAHLADCEIAFGFRLRQTLAGEPMIQPFDQDAWAGPYASFSAELALATFTALRGWNVALVRTFSEADMQKPATHPERGTMTLRTLVETMAGHDRHHLVKLEEVV